MEIKCNHYWYHNKATFQDSHLKKKQKTREELVEQAHILLWLISHILVVSNFSAPLCLFFLLNCGCSTHLSMPLLNGREEHQIRVLRSNQVKTTRRMWFMETRVRKGFQEMIFKKKKTFLSYLVHLLIHHQKNIEVMPMFVPASVAIKPEAS